MLPDELADEREEQLILAAEVPVEGLEGDASLPDDGLCREVRPVCGDQKPAGRGIFDRGPESSPDARPSFVKFRHRRHH